MKAHFEKWLEKTDTLVVLLKKAYRAIDDYLTRIEIEENKPLLERYLITSRFWLEEKVEENRLLIQRIEHNIIESNKLLESINKSNEQFTKKFGKLPTVREQ